MVESYLDYYNKHRERMPTIEERDSEYTLVQSRSGTIGDPAAEAKLGDSTVLIRCSEVSALTKASTFTEAQATEEQTEEEAKRAVEASDSAFFAEAYKYDTNFLALPEADFNQSVKLGLYLDLSAISHDAGCSRASTKLSRMGRSDPVEESDCFEGSLEKKSPKLFVGWQVGKNCSEV